MTLIRNVGRKAPPPPRKSFKQQVADADAARTMKAILNAARGKPQVMKEAEVKMTVVSSDFVDETGKVVNLEEMEMTKNVEAMPRPKEDVTEDVLTPMSGADIMESTFLNDRKAFDLVAYLETFRKEGTFRQEGEVSEPVGADGVQVEEPVADSPVDAVQDTPVDMVGDNVGTDGRVGDQSGDGEDLTIEDQPVDDEYDLVLQHGCWYRDKSGCAIQVFMSDQEASDLPAEVLKRYPFCKQGGHDFFTRNGIHYGNVIGAEDKEDLVELITSGVIGAV